jgi:hypothetical protein
LSFAEPLGDIGRHTARRTADLVGE